MCMYRGVGLDFGLGRKKKKFCNMNFFFLPNFFLLNGAISLKYWVGYCLPGFDAPVYVYPYQVCRGFDTTELYWKEGLILFELNLNDVWFIGAEIRRQIQNYNGVKIEANLCLGPLFKENFIIIQPLIISQKQHRDLASSFLALLLIY